MRHVLQLAAILALVPTAAVSADVSFRSGVAPVLERKCAACHLKEGPMAGIILEPRLAYRMIVNVPSSRAIKLVSPGDPERSYLLMKMENRHRVVGGTGDKMPPGWFTATPVEIELVRSWIAAGAPDN